MTVSLTVPDVAGLQSSLMGCNQGKKQYMCHDGVNETLTALGVEMVNTTQHYVKKTNLPLSEKQQVPLLPVQKFGVSVPYCNMQVFTD